MKIRFSEKNYNLIKSVDISDIKDYIQFFDDERAIEMLDIDLEFVDYYGRSYNETPLGALLLCIDAEILASGISEDQNAILPRGQELYRLYDSILYSAS